MKRYDFVPPDVALAALLLESLERLAPVFFILGALLGISLPFLLKKRSLSALFGALLSFLCLLLAVLGFLLGADRRAEAVLLS